MPITGHGLTAYRSPDDALSSSSKNAVQNKVIDEELSDVKNAISELDGGTTGQLLRKRSNTDYDFEWSNVGQPTDAQVESAVSDWLDEHPEATTTVEDGSLTYEKLVAGTLGFVTPEMYGAKGDGETNDSSAFALAFAANSTVHLTPNKRYLVTQKINLTANTVFDGEGSTIICGGNTPINIAGDNVVVKNVRLEGTQAQTQYGINIATGVKNANVRNIYGNELKYSLVMNDGTDSLIENCHANLCGWDCVSNYTSAKNAVISNCFAIKTKRHGFSTDEGANGIQFINCYAEDIGSIAGEGHSCYHFEGVANCKIINCKAVYTQNHPKLDNFGSDLYVGLRVDTATSALINNLIDGLEIIYESGFHADNEQRIVPLYFTAPSTALSAKLSISNLAITNETTQTYESYLGVALLSFYDFSIKGRLPIKQYSINGLIVEMVNGSVDLIDSVSDFYYAQYIASGFHCANVHAQNCNRFVRGRLVDCVIENCVIENCEQALALTQQAGDSNQKSTGNIIRNNILANHTTGIRLGWWTGTGNNIICNNMFKGTIGTIISTGTNAGCYFYDNIQSDLTYTTGAENVTITATPPLLELTN